MSTTVNAEPTVDPRPAPPPMPTLYVVRYFEWQQPFSKGGRGEWNAKTSWTKRTPEEAQAEAEGLMYKGCRCVEIITIVGQEPQP